MVFDGAATFRGLSLNDNVFSGANLLNGLVDVLTRLRIGKYACMADLSKWFFHVAMPENQQDLSCLIWFKDNNLDCGELQLFRFTRHVWEVNSSPYIAHFAI